ncbi:MAG: hypothetical protein Q8O19_01370, partial [Rectinemataceae bacterium]|nr:hypothetical protein [Rectinemataceae bacterium]
MKRFLFGLLFLQPALCLAESVSLNFNSISVSQFAQATYKVMLKRDYVLSPELLSMEKLISISVKNIDSSELPKFVEGILAGQGVRSVQRDGVYYLGVVSDVGSSGGMPLSLSGNVRSLPGAIDPPGRVSDLDHFLNARTEKGVDDVQRI